MKEFHKKLKSGTQVVVTINAPCGFTMNEGAVIANVSGTYIKIVLPAATDPRMDHLPIGTIVSVSMETASGEQFASNGLISSLDERPFIWVKILELLPVFSKRRCQRISVNLPMYCSVIREDGSISVIYDGKKDNGMYEPTDLSLSAGGFKLKTPFKLKDETTAITVFFSPDESEWMIPVFSKSIYSHLSPASSNFLTGFRFSMINSRDRKKIDNLVREHLLPTNPSGRARKYPSCLLRIRNNSIN